MDKRSKTKTNGSMRVLLVGRERDRLVGLRDLLRRATSGRTQVDYACSLQEARECLEKTTHDLVLCASQDDETALQLSKDIATNGRDMPLLFLEEQIKENGEEAEEKVDRLIQYTLEKQCEKRQCQQKDERLRKLQSALEHSPEMVAITDSAGTVEYVNPAFEELTGYSGREIIGRTLRILKSDEEQQATYRLMWETVLAGNTFRGTVVNRRKSGENFVAEKIIVPVRNEGGTITHFVSFDRDITEQRKLEAQLRQAQKMDAVGRLAGGIAHDFNNLLLIMSAYAELMQESLAPQHPLRNNVEQILTAVRRAADLTRQLLGFSRKQMQALQLLDLNSVVRGINRMLPRLIGEDIDLRFIAGAGLGKVKADAGQIEQIVLNLAANARDAMPGGGKLTIETMNVELDETYAQQRSMVPPGEYVLLSVADTGMGIAPQHLPNIFEPFYTTKEDGKGTGLGLATVYGIVKQSAGFIWVYSEVGLGTTFKIYLPRAEDGHIRPSLPESPELSTIGQETVLLVEDEQQVLRSASEFLTLKGYRVLQAENGEKALQVSRQHDGPIDIMITDVVMPRLGGTQLAARMFTDRPSMKVLFVSGYAESTILGHGKIDMTGHFLAKPFTLKALALKVREVVEQDGKASRAATASN